MFCCCCKSSLVARPLLQCKIVFATFFGKWLYGLKWFLPFFTILVFWSLQKIENDEKWFWTDLRLRFKVFLQNNLIYIVFCYVGFLISVKKMYRVFHEKVTKKWLSLGNYVHLTWSYQSQNAFDSWYFGQVNDKYSVFHLTNCKSVFHILILNTLYAEFYLENWKESSMQGMFLFASFAESKSHYLLFFTVPTPPLCRSNPTININKKTICILKTQN